MSRESQLDICEECGEALDLHETLCLSAAADVLPLFEAREERLRAELLDTQREVAHLRGEGRESNGWREMKAQRDAALAKYDRLVEQVRRQIRGTSSAATVRDGLRAAVVDSPQGDDGSTS